MNTQQTRQITPEQTRKRAKQNSQRSQRRLNVRKLEKDCLIRDSLVVEHQADSPDDRGEADVLCAGEVVEDDFGVSFCRVGACGSG